MNSLLQKVAEALVKAKVSFKIDASGKELIVSATTPAERRKNKIEQRSWRRTHPSNVKKSQKKSKRPHVIDRDRSKAAKKAHKLYHY